MNDGYLGIVVLMVIAAVLAVGLVSVCWLLGPKKNTPYKSAPYECGVAPIGDANERFPVKFYLVAIVFIMFDIEAVFLWGFYAAYKNSTDTQFLVYGFVEFLTYIATWILGYVYAIRVGAIDWDETTSLAPEKLGLPAEVSAPLEESIPRPSVVLVGGPS
jgi:NADH-quinone oxidoreductase subunit A